MSVPSIGQTATAHTKFDLCRLFLRTLAYVTRWYKVTEEGLVEEKWTDDCRAYIDTQWTQHLRRRYSACQTGIFYSRWLGPLADLIDRGLAGEAGGTVVIKRQTHLEALVYLEYINPMQSDFQSRRVSIAVVKRLRRCTKQVQASFADREC